MKVTHAETHVLGSGGLGEASDFKIRTSPHAFKMLSSGLYSDKVSAVLREIGCNGQDAHIAAGCPHRPIEVKLPNQIDPQFYIRDHGPGMSDEEIRELYTTYFASTKQQSNDFTGAFGLGSKSPFSYTDSFTIMSCHGGKKRVYTAHINQKGVPVVAPMGEVPVEQDWKTGVQIGFPVKPTDFRDFEHKAGQIFRHFNPVPVIHGAAEIKPIKIDADFGNYAFLDKDDPICNDGVSVLMGNVRYPLDMSKLNIAQNKWSTRSKLTDYIWDLRGLLLRFKIGELMVAGSRETLEYDEDTQTAIKKRLDSVLTSIATEIHTSWVSATTWQEQCDFKELALRVSRGIQLDETLFQLAGIKANKDIAAACRRHGYILPQIDANPKAVYSLLHKDPLSEHFRLKIKRPLNGEAMSMDFIKDIKIIWGAEDRALARVKEAFRKEELDGHVLLVAANTKDKGTLADVDILFKQVKDRLPGVDVLNLADYEAPAIVRTSKKKGGKALPDEEILIEGVRTKLSAVDDEKKVYVPVTIRSNWGNIRKTWLIDDKHSLDSWHRDNLLSYVKTLNNKLNLGIIEPIEIPKAEARRLKMADRPEWVSYKDYIRIILEDTGNLDLLKNEVKDDGYSIELTYHYGYSQGILENLVYMRHKLPSEFKKIEHILVKHDILDNVLDVYKRSLGHSGYRRTEPAALTAYREAASLLGLTITTPEYKIMTLDVNDKFSFAATKTWDQLVSVMQFVPSLFPQIIDELLTKGTEKV